MHGHHILIFFLFVYSRKRLKKHRHKNLQRKTRRPHHAISTSSAVGSFEGRRHCLDHLFSIAMVFPLLPGGKKIA